MRARIPIDPNPSFFDALDFSRRYKVDEATGCHVWTGTVNNKGYGVWQRDNRRLLAHRVAYTWAKGPIPNNLELDHLCRNPLCINPDHLEPVTHHENILRGESPVAQQARKTHCKHGHPLSGDNLYITSKGYRHCKACGESAVARLRERRPDYYRNYYQEHKEQWAKYKENKRLAAAAT